MDLLLEQEIWRSAQAALGQQTLEELLEKAVGAYRRSPDYSPSTRLHENLIGSKVLRFLSRDRHGGQRPQVAAVAPGYVEVRMAFRGHLGRYLLRHLVESSLASEALMEAHLAFEIGV